jgi:uncharacterized membrane protein YqjE
MENRTPASSGLIDAFRKLGESLIGTIHDRIELLSVEFQEEKLRLIRLFVAISIALFAGMMAVTFASITLVYLFWESARLVVLIALTLLYGGAAAWIVLGVRRSFHTQPKPFEGTLQELKEDRECFRTPN